MQLQFSRRTVVFIVAVLAIAILAFLAYDRIKLHNLSPEEKVAKQAEVHALIESGDFNQCNAARGLNIDGIDYEAVCRNNIAIKNAFTELDLKWCDELDNKLMLVQDCKDQILLNQASSTPNLEKCNQIFNPDRHAYCLAVYWTKQALAEKKTEVCTNIVNLNYRAACRDYVVKRL